MATGNTKRITKAGALAMVVAAVAMGVIASSGIAEAGAAGPLTGPSAILGGARGAVADRVNGLHQTVAEGLAHIEYRCVGRYLSEWH